MMLDFERAHFLSRLRILAGVMLVLMLALLARLWTVQVHQGGGHRQAIARQSIRRIRLNPVRGRLFAADGQTLLVDNRPSFDVMFHIPEMRQPGPRARTLEFILEQARRLAEVSGRPVPFDREDLERHFRVYPALPITVFADLNVAEQAAISELLPPVPGMEIRVRTLRSYPFPGLATHLLGFAGRRPPPDQYERDQFSYVMPELHGRAGLELVYDQLLSGRAGSRLVRVDTLGFVHQQIGDSQEARSGHDLVLTVDLRAQMVAERVLAASGRRSALVAVEVGTGAVLAMASAPSYDLSTLTAADYTRLSEDDANRPLVNRAISAGYLPGSIIKPLIALSALEAGTVSPEELIDCNGGYRLSPKARPIRCWNRSGHGPLNLVGAIKHSCNPYFIEIGQRTGYDRIRPVLAAAGLGEAPALDLNGAGAGLLPTRAWARGHYQRDWIAADTAFLSMGQGALNLSPLQAAIYTAAIANGGTLYRPFLVKAVRDAQNNYRQQTAPQPRHRLPVAKSSLEIVRQGMVAVVNDEDGSAKAARNPAISLAGKTGTAEVGHGENRSKNTWFIAYGPIEEPRYAVAVLVEEGQSGGSTAAPLASQFFATWLRAQ